MGGNKLLGPKGVAVADSGELIVIDNKGSAVFILHPASGKVILKRDFSHCTFSKSTISLKVLTKFGSRGSEGPQFAGPHYVATNSHGNIVISDFHNHNIKIFTKDGAFIFSFGTNGEIQHTFEKLFALYCK